MRTIEGKRRQGQSWALHAAELKDLPKQLQARKNVEVDPLEEVFLDDPRAGKEQEPIFRRSSNR
jgi:hypothetical protein